MRNAQPWGATHAARLAVVLLAVMLALPRAATAEDDDWGDEGDSFGSGPAYTINGFAEAAGSGRVVDDPTTRRDFTMGEARFRLEARHERDMGSLSFKGDFLADGVTRGVEIDIREALLTVNVTRWLSIRAGRQVLTWGTGDLLFLNDLFPKDWQSFFIGRDDEFLKAPSNAVKVALYSSALNLDLVWTPIFSPDRYITGERLSFFNPMAGQIIGGEVLVAPEEPPLQLRTGELAARLHRRLGSVELAAYGYYGYWKQPLGFSTCLNKPVFPRLGVYGASLRSPLWGGIFNLEGAFYHSHDDWEGRNPMVPNSQVRGLAGYEHELVSKMTLGVQYYVEHILRHDRLMDSSPTPQFEPDELRHVTTLRWMYRLLRDDLTLSLFTFFSPSDMDVYVRPKVSYKLTDGIQATVGANIVFGEEDYTFFGQFKENTNVYTRLRYTF